jgi:hypothetical protein
MVNRMKTTIELPDARAGEAEESGAFVTVL